MGTMSRVRPRPESMMSDQSRLATLRREVPAASDTSVANSPERR